MTKNINPWWLLITMLVFFALVKLGWWQTERANEKKLRIARMEALQNEQGFCLTDVINLAKNNEIINDLPVTFEGQLNDNILILLDNQMNNGQFGFRVLQVVNAEQQQVLINLGWHVGDRTRQTSPTIQPLSGRYQFSGNVREVEQGVLLQEQQLSNEMPLLIQQIDIEKIATALNIQLLPFVVYLDEKNKLGYEKNWQPIVMPPEKHQAYAFQWFSLAFAWLCLMIWAAIKAKRDKGS